MGVVAMYEAIPEELKQLPRWVCWRFVTDPARPEKPRKVPLDALTGKAARSNDPGTWHSFQDAVDHAPQDGGIGFMFGGGIFGVDIDGIDQDILEYRQGNLDTICGEFIDTLQSYAEWSVSGRGLHIICRGKLPPGGRRRANVEMYETGRFFIMTGNAASEYTEVAECTERIRALHEKYIGGGVVPSLRPEPAAPPPVLGDDDILQRAAASRQGAVFSALWAGRWEDFYSSQSEADLRLCSMLAFWTGRDEARMDTLFRQSGLMRPKWDRKQKGTTYGAITVHKAAEECRDVWRGDSSGDDYSITIARREKPAYDARRYTLDDTGNAARFYDLFGQSALYCHPEGRWYWWDGRRWCEDRQGVVRGFADETMEAMRDDLEAYIDADQGKTDAEELEKAYMKHLKRCRAQATKTAMLAEAAHLCPVLPEEFDRDGMLLNTPSGVVDLHSGELLSHDPALRMARITRAEYSPTAVCPVWMTVLAEAMGGDGDLVDFWQKLMGYALTGDTTEQAMAILIGDGRNGKSTILETAAEVLGDYAANMRVDSITMSGRGSGSSSDIARLAGARFVTCAESGEGVRLDEGQIKNLTGGDRITARRLYADEMEFVPQFKIFMSTNHKPVIRGTDLGIWRRLWVVPFNVTIPDDKVDRHLRGKLRAESSGILRWMVEGCLRWQREGLRLPDAVEEARRQYRGEMDVVAAFLSECVDHVGTVMAGDLYRAYTAWARENNEFVMSSQRFGREMAKRCEKEHRREGWVYSGLSLKLQSRSYTISV